MQNHQKKRINFVQLYKNKKNILKTLDIPRVTWYNRIMVKSNLAGHSPESGGEIMQVDVMLYPQEEGAPIDAYSVCGNDFYLGDIQQFKIDGNTLNNDDWNRLKDELEPLIGEYENTKEEYENTLEGAENYDEVKEHYEKIIDNLDEWHSTIDLPENYDKGEEPE